MPDNTSAIQALIDKSSSGEVVVIPEGRYDIDAVRGIHLKSDMTLKLEHGAVLAAIPNDQQKYAILDLAGCSNVTVSGPGTIYGERDKHIGTNGGEWGHGISLKDAGSNIVINSSLVITRCWGDGIYVQDASNVLIDNVISDGNRRQGASVISVNGLRVKDSIFRNTGGTAPGCGIDMETDHGDQSISNVVIERNQFYNNAGSSIAVGSPAGIYKNIVIRGDNTHDRKTQPIWVSQAAGKLGEPVWATALSAFKGQSWYRWWGYPTSWNKG